MPKSVVADHPRAANAGSMRGRKRRMLGRFAHLMGVVSLFGYVIVFPPWVGNSYMPDYDKPGSYYWHGTFGLLDAEMRSPIWSPPQAHSPLIESTVRWPWQSASSNAHVELSTFRIAWQIAIGMVLLGLGLRLWNGVSARNNRDRFVDVAWSTSLGTAISILGLVIFGAFTAGYGLTDGIVVGGLSAGAFLGLTYGAVTFRSEHARPSLLSVSQLAWFAVGLGVATLIMIVAGYVASGVRGDPVGVSELGTSVYAGNQRLINVVTGIGIVFSGLAASWLSAWSRMPRGLVVGLFVGALVLGITYAISF